MAKKSLLPPADIIDGAKATRTAQNEITKRTFMSAIATGLTPFSTTSKKSDPGFSGGGYPDRKVLKVAASTATNLEDFRLNEPGREGDFVFVSGDFSAEIAADPFEGVYIRSGTIPPTTGVLIRTNRTPLKPSWFGVWKDGTSTAARFQNMLDMAEGRVELPSGRYNLENTIKIRQGLMIEGIGSARPSIRGADTGGNQAIIEGNTNGDLFSFTGAPDVPRNSGFGFRNISIVQTKLGSSVGSAVKIAPMSDAHQIAWVNITDLNIEKQSMDVADWKWGLEFDGSSTTLPSRGIRDVFLSGIRVVCGPNARGALLVSGMFNVFVERFEANLENNLIRVTGQSSNCFFSDVTVGEFEVNNASNVFGTNLSATTIRTSASAKHCIIYGSCSVLDLQGSDNWFVGFVGNEFTIVNSSTRDMKMDLKSRLIVEKTITATDYILQIRNGAGFGAGLQFETRTHGVIEALGRIYGVTRAGYDNTGLEFWTKLAGVMTKRLIISQDGALLPATDGDLDIGSAKFGFNKIVTKHLVLDESAPQPDNLAGKSILYMDGDDIKVRKSNGSVLTYSPNL